MKNWVGTLQNIRRHHDQLDQLPERYVSMNHPRTREEEKAGASPTRPVYEIDPSGAIQRVSLPQVDIRIIQASGCLPGIDVDVTDTQMVSQLALEAVQHYARLDAVIGFFLPHQIQDYILREKKSFQYYETDGKHPEERLPTEAQVRLYTGTENLLLEMSLGLSTGEVITDRLVREKINSLIEDCLNCNVD